MLRNYLTELKKSLLQSGMATGAASFHAQQRVEKALKAVLEE